MFNQEEVERQLDVMTHIGAERAVLNIALNDPDTLFDICSDLSPADFRNAGNRMIFEIMMQILDNKYANISRINPMIIHAIAQNNGIIEEIGGMQYLKVLQESNAGVENLKFYVEKVRQASIRRESFRKALTVIRDCVECEDEDINSFTSRQEEKFLDIVMMTNGTDEFVRVGDRIDIVLEKRESSPREMLGMPTGFTEYDLITGGCVPGRLKCIAATAKTGKSAIALNIAIHVAIKNFIPVLYIDTEMPTEEQIDRMVSILATEIAGFPIPESAITKGLYVRNEAMKEAVDEAKAIIKEAPFYHVYMPHFTPEKVHNMARKFQRQFGIDWNGYSNQFLLIFDYIKLPDGQSGDKEYVVLGQIANKLKNDIAGVLNIPVLTFAQLNPRTGHGVSNDINSSYMSGSNRIVMFVNELAFLTKKTEQEIERDGPDSGNLIFQLGETRNGGTYKGWIDYNIRRGVPSMREIRNVAG